MNESMTKRAKNTQAWKPAYLRIMSMKSSHVCKNDVKNYILRECKVIVAECKVVCNVYKKYVKSMYTEYSKSKQIKMINEKTNNCQKGKRVVNNKFWQFVEQTILMFAYQKAEQAKIKIAKIHRCKYASMNKNYSKLNKINYSGMYVWR